MQLDQRFDLWLVTERHAQEIVATMARGLCFYVTVIHGTELLDYFGTSHEVTGSQRMKRFYAEARVCIAVSNATAQLATRLLRDDRIRLATIHNGIDLARLPVACPDESRRLRQQFGENVEIVFCLGRLDLDKGQDVLIKAFGKVRQSRPHARLLIGGDGPYREDLLKLRGGTRPGRRCRIPGQDPLQITPCLSFDMRCIRLGEPL